jgi:hypothetical protein
MSEDNPEFTRVLEQDNCATCGAVLRNFGAEARYSLDTETLAPDETKPAGSLWAIVCTECGEVAATMALPPSEV